MNVLVKVWVTDRVGLRSVDSPGFQLGAERPLWVPDEEVAYCHICKAPFTTFRRRVSSFTTVSQLCPNVIAASLPSLWPHLLQSMFLKATTCQQVGVYSCPSHATFHNAFLDKPHHVHALARRERECVCVCVMMRRRRRRRRRRKSTSFSFPFTVRAV